MKMILCLGGSTFGAAGHGSATVRGFVESTYRCCQDVVS